MGNSDLISSSVYPKPPKSSFSKWKLLLFILIIVSTGITTWYFFKQNSDTPYIPIDGLNKPISLEEQTSDWFRYRNEKRGFTFKYPTDWQMEWNTLYSPEMFNAREGGPYSLLIDIESQYNVASATSTKCVENLATQNLEEKEFAVFTDSCMYGSPTIFQFNLDGRKINGMSYSFDKKENETILKILSTVEFITAQDPLEVDTSEWQIYRNEEFGFEFEHPPYLHFKSSDKKGKITEIMFVNGAGFDELKIRIEPGHKTIAEAFSPFLLTLMRNVTTVNNIPAFEINAAEATARTIHLFGVDSYITITKLNLSNDLKYFDELISTFVFN